METSLPVIENSESIIHPYTPTFRIDQLNPALNLPIALVTLINATAYIE